MFLMRYVHVAHVGEAILMRYVHPVSKVFPIVPASGWGGACIELFLPLGGGGRCVCVFYRSFARKKRTIFQKDTYFSERPSPHRTIYVVETNLF